MARMTAELVHDGLLSTAAEVAQETDLFEGHLVPVNPGPGESYR